MTSKGDPLFNKIAKTEPHFYPSGHCGFDCPFLKYDNTAADYEHIATCIKSGEELFYYDGYLADCEEANCES